MAGLLGMLGGKGASAEKSAPAPGGKSPDLKTMAAEDLIEAVKSGDASAVASAFQSMYDHCATKKSGGAMGEYAADAEEETELA